MNKLRLFIYAFLILSFSISSALSIAGISIEPDTIEKMGRQMERIKDVIVVTNNQGNSVDIKVTLSNWLKQDLDSKEWLKVEPTEFSLNPGESKNVNYTVDVFPGITGELMCMIFFTVSNKGEEKNSVGMQIGIPFYIAISDTVNYKVEIEGCKLQLEDRYLRGDILISNMSNAHMRPKIKAELEGLDKSLYPVAYVKYGVPVRAGEKKYFSFSKEIKGNVPEQCGVTVIVNYGIGGKHDLELKRTFENVKVYKDTLVEETTQETKIGEEMPGGVI